MKNYLHYSKDFVRRFYLSSSLFSTPDFIQLSSVFIDKWVLLSLGMHGFSLPESYRKLSYQRSIYWAPLIARVNCKSGLYYEKRLSASCHWKFAKFVSARLDYYETNLILIPALQFQHQWRSSVNKQETSQGTYFKVRWTLLFLLWKMQTLCILNTFTIPERISIPLLCPITADRNGCL